MIKAKEIDGELWIKASDHHQAIKEALAQKQEPVAHWSDCAVHSEPAYPKGECDCGGFATPPQRTWVGLTDENLRKLADEHLFYQPEGYEVSGVFAFARAIEAKLKDRNTNGQA